MKIYRILGKEGRTTIPYDIRIAVGFRENDVLSFSAGKDGKSVIVTREKICDNCRTNRNPVLSEPEDREALSSVLDGFSPEQQKAALLHLLMKWAEQKGRGRHA